MAKGKEIKISSKISRDSQLPLSHDDEAAVLFVLSKYIFFSRVVIRKFLESVNF